MRGVVLILTVLTLFGTALQVGCRGRREAQQAPVELDGEVSALQTQVSVLLLENERLQRQLTAGTPWTGVVQLPAAGSSRGDVPFTRRCPNGEALIGIRGTSGALIDALGGICAPLEQIHDHLPEGTLALRRDLPMVGSLTRGAPYEVACNADEAVVGARFHFGDLIDNLELRCASVRPAPPATASTPAASTPATQEGTGQALPPVTEPATTQEVVSEPRTVRNAAGIGGPGGTNDLEVLCPEGYVVVGFHGYLNQFVSNVALECAPLP